MKTFSFFPPISLSDMQIRGVGLISDTLSQVNRTLLC